MNDELERLTALDALDREIEGHRAERAKLLAQRAEARKAAETAKRTQAIADAALNDSRTEERVQQRRLEELRTSRAAALRVLATGIGNAEAAQRQLERCDGLIDVAETQLLELLEVQDGHAATATTNAAAAARAENALQALEVSAPRAVAERDAAIAELTVRREAASSELPRDLRTRYEAFRSRSMHAVAHVRDGACLECRMEVQPQHMADLKRGRLEPCRGCHRWLVLTP